MKLSCFVLLLGILAGFAHAGITAITPASPFTATTIGSLINWQVCHRAPFTSTGPDLNAELFPLCAGTRLIWGCAQAASNVLIVGAGATKTVISTESFSDNAQWFLDTVGIGSGGFVNVSDTPPSSCGLMGLIGSPTVGLCYNFNGTRIAGGGFCGSAGPANTAAFERVVLAAPCHGLSVGSPCTPPEGLCVSSPTCQVGGACVGTAIPLPPLDQCQASVTCDPLTGNFIFTNKSFGSVCQDGQGCTVNDQCDGMNNCLAGSAYVCPAPPMCASLGVCVALNATTPDCQYAPLPVNAGCSDFLACTLGDKCDGNYVCNSGAVKECPPSNSCQNNGTCTEPLATCVPNFKPDLTICNSTNKCATTSWCVSGACQPQVFKDCSQPGSGGTCQVNATCNTVSGNCNGVPAPAGFPCVEDPCQTGQVCNSGGLCVGGSPALPCNSPPTLCSQSPGFRQAVNASFCQCVYPDKLPGDFCAHPDPCVAGGSCLALSCIPNGPVDCNAEVGTGDPCTNGPGSCIPMVGCPNWEPNGISCTDPTECKIGTTCQSGKCSGGTSDFNNPFCARGCNIRSWFFN